MDQSCSTVSNFPANAPPSLGMRLSLPRTPAKKALNLHVSALHLLVDFPNACGNILLVVRKTSGSSTLRWLRPNPLQISGGTLSAVQCCDGPCRLNNCDCFLSSVCLAVYYWLLSHILSDHQSLLLCLFWKLLTLILCLIWYFLLKHNDTNHAGSRSFLSICYLLFKILSKWEVLKKYLNTKIKTTI